MNINRITDGDVGRLFQTNDGQMLRVIRVYGPLIFGQMESGKVYYPIHDILRRVTEVTPSQPRKKKYEEKAEPEEKRPRGNLSAAKRVTVIDPDGVKQVFCSASEASRAIGVSPGCISTACRRRSKAAGYTCIYE